MKQMAPGSKAVPLGMHLASRGKSNDWLTLGICTAKSQRSHWLWAAGRQQVQSAVQHAMLPLSAAMACWVTGHTASVSWG
jgi:hypothetical protein